MYGSNFGEVWINNVAFDILKAAKPEGPGPAPQRRRLSHRVTVKSHGQCSRVPLSVAASASSPRQAVTRSFVVASTITCPGSHDKLETSANFKLKSIDSKVISRATLEM